MGPALTILDGVWAMEGNGPANGSTRPMGLVAAARDAVALDVSNCTMLGVSLRSFPLYRVARSKGIGETDMARIHLKGELPRTFSVSDFEVPALDSIGLLPAIFFRKGLQVKILNRFNR